MRTRFTGFVKLNWVVGMATLLAAAALLVACSTKYSSSSNGLIVVSTQGNAVMDSFSLDLGNGHVTQIFNTNGPPTMGVPTGLVLAPGGMFAYLLVTANSAITSNGSTGIESFPVASDGKLSAGTVTALAPEAVAGSSTTIPVTPTALTIDSSGKFLFVAESVSNAAGAVSVFSLSGATLTEVAGSPFVLPAEPRNALPVASALAVTPTSYPPAYAECSGATAPTTENLYVTDSANYVVLNYSVSSSGVLSLVEPSTLQPGVPTGTVPSGVTVDPCNRFVYVSNAQPDDMVNAFTICTVKNVPQCQTGDFSLLPVPGTVQGQSGTTGFPAGNNPGPLLMDAYANYLYVLNTGGNSIQAYRVSTTTGALAQLTPATVTTNSYPASIAIRSDDSWLFVTNVNSANISEYAITPSTGQLTPQTAVQTDNNPWGIAVR